MTREEIGKVIEYLKEGNMLTTELEDILNKCEGKDGSGIEYVLNEVNSIEDLRVLTDYEFCYAYETEEEVTVKGLNIGFHKRLKDGRYIYRDLLICANGFKFLSEEHF